MSQQQLKLQDAAAAGAESAIANYKRYAGVLEEFYLGVGIIVSAYTYEFRIAPSDAESMAFKRAHEFTIESTVGAPFWYLI